MFNLDNRLRELAQYDFFSKSKNNAGFTLFEVLIYIALFGLIIGGGIASSYQIFEGSAQIKGKTVIEAEANFLLRKLDWAVSGAKITMPTSGNTGDTLRAEHDGSHEYEFELDGSGIMTIDNINNGTPALPLNSDNVTVTNLEFEHIAANAGVPAAVTFSFDLNGQSFGPITRFVR